MSLFQKSVEKKYLNELDSVLIDQKYKEFQNYFENPSIQENIRNSKEEQFQEGFLRELFVSIFGYTLNPQPNFNLTTELKNIANSKKADGAILKGDDAIAVIELKGTDTTDLDKIESQAFGYKNHHPKCVYVITSNFEKLRFYIQNAVDYIDFDLFNLSREQFSLLWLCLAKDNLLNGLPQKIKESSLLQEENITKKLYADYSKFREAIYNNLVKNNPETDKLLLFKKTQKLLDRFLFIFFAEDRLLLPPNSISEIVKQWTTLKDEMDEYVPLYDRFKKYFGYMNTGYKGKKYDIYAYNGGLFAPDEILDNVSIDDEILHKHTLTLSQYDFETDVDVNILGHIFEHSLGEIENITASISTMGLNPLLNNTSKRKKDGIFYTPKYITKYIVENTVGKLCEEKRTELEIIDEEYAKGRKNRKKEIITALDNKLTEYRNWLMSITILDPACGSGAFLNQALDFLITEHRKIDDLRAQLFGSALVFSDITNDILEKNIYGVDLNEESVEIAKLSLWLRTAQKGRKLNTLNNNIKCGNSLIDDPEVAGEKAFNWQNEFPNIFREKEKKAWHITTATHNSRYSQRMFNNHVVLGEAEWFDTEDEIIITQTVLDIAIADKLNVLEYNICGDHMHILLVCEEEELSKIVGKLKSVSAKIRNRKRGYTAESRTTASTRGHAPLSRDGDGDDDSTKRGETQRQVWTQKFGKSEIKDEKYLANAIEYIRNNRKKHELPEIKEIEKLKKELLCTLDHAFRPEYKGGFDVVIGNPPYIKEATNKNAFNGLHDDKCYQGKMDLWYFFGSLAIDIVKKESGLIGYIAPNNWITNDGASKFRDIVLQNGKLIEFVDFGDFKIFDTAGIQTMIYIMKNTADNSCYCLKYSKIIDKKITHEDAKLFLEKIEDNRFEYFDSEMSKKQYLGKTINFINLSLNFLVEKIERKKNFFFYSDEIASGIDLLQDFVNKNHKEVIENVEIGDGIFNLSQTEYQNLNFSQTEKELIKPFYTTKEFQRFYGDKQNNYWIIYTNSEFKDEEKLIPYPNIKKHLDKFIHVLTSVNKPYGLHRAREEKYFKGEKILSLRKCSKRPTFTYTDFDAYVNRTFLIIKTDRINLKFLTALLNSNVIALWLKLKGKLQGDNFQIDKNPLLGLPLIKPDEVTESDVSDLVATIIENNQKIIAFARLLEKAKVENNFEREIKLEKEINSFKEEITTIESKINLIVNQLYGLTHEEIKIVEGTV